MARVPARRPSRGGAGGRVQRGAAGSRLTLRAISRPFVVHLALSVLVLALAGALVTVELASPCPAGGPLAFGSCAVRPFAIGVLLLAAGLYVVGLSAVLAWTSGLRRRGVADAGSARDWYLLGALVGLPVAPLLAFTLLSALR